ncbi:hypothetical protein O6H91_14G035500 [Diphasiastrum complanatum]|uniref:Uncharacterized protein n=1 Tax=Diphasiastrum complanatum TaxID=34168 RepID=A0ACC2BN37_DIPCM|nr:hypothetical protein O6H91_14G035500 [Diphasiastrum complanatum]
MQRWAVANWLLICSARCGMKVCCQTSLKDAHLVFDEMLDRDVVSWNAIIAACSRNNAGGQALELFVRMLEDGLAPTKVTFLNLLDACISISSLEHGKLMHACISGCGLASDLALANALINMYGKCGSPEHARFVFEKMLERDVVSWTSMISVCAQHGLHKEAIKLFEEMQTKGVKPNRVTVLSVLGACASPAALAQGKLFHQYLVRNGFNYDSAVGNALINMYAKCGSLEDACSLFKKLAKRDVVSWNTLIAMYNQHGHADAALEAFRKMQSIGVLPDKITLLSLFEACASLAALEEGTSIHASFFDKQQLKLDSTMATALLNMYGKCGSLEDSRCIFNSLAERDVVSWNSMIVTYAQHGYGLLGLQLFSMMQDGYLEPDNITFIAVLSACSHSGLVQEGIHYFASMKMYHKFIPTMRHYGCMVDLFCRAGELGEAECVITNMPFEPDAAIRMMLLSACRLHGDVERGNRAALNLLELDPKNGAPYLVMSNLYAAAGLWDKVAKLSELMIAENVDRQSGCSIVYVKNKKHVFVVRDSFHPQKKAIYAEVERLSRLTKQAGYVPDLNLELHNTEEEQKEKLLLSHSEKLAIAFALISTPSKTTIRIIKNLRVCGDCHSFLKVLSKIVGREVVIRDASRFHHFKDGLCSCGDYW